MITVIGLLASFNISGSSKRYIDTALNYFESAKNKLYFPPIRILNPKFAILLENTLKTLRLISMYPDDTYP